MLAKTLVLLLATVAATSSSLQHNWTYQHGALAAGNDLQKGNYTLAEAESICVSLPGCIGFTYHSSNAKSAAVEAITSSYLFPFFKMHEFPVWLG